MNNTEDRKDRCYRMSLEFKSTRSTSNKMQHNIVEIRSVAIKHVVGLRATLS